MNEKEFIEKYCDNCGSQRCEGIGTEWFEGCRHKNELNNFQNNKELSNQIIEDQIKFIDIDDAERLEKIYHITMELHARETSGNCVVSELVNKSWVELCDEGVRLFQELKE